MAANRGRRQSGAKGSFQLPEDRQEGVRGRDKNSNWTPDYSDPVFFEKLENFHKAFSARYADHESVQGGSFILDVK